MRSYAVILSALLCLSSLGWSQQLLVFPAVTAELPGQNDSLWVTVVRLVKVDPAARVTVRRKWVCLPGGGFVDDPANPPTWTELIGTHHSYRVLVVWGGPLLGVASAGVGAVALEIEGGEVLAHAYLADVLRGEHYEGHWSAGQGQLIPAFRDALVGPSYIPWLGGTNELPYDPPPEHQYLRNNIGLVNPNPEPLVITGTAIPFDSLPPTQLGPPEAFVKELPPYGWLQFHWQATNTYGPDEWGGPYSPTAGFVLNLTPDKELPYYAYASVVFSPDPASGVPAFSDPMYVPAEPGYIPVGGEAPPR